MLVEQRVVEDGSVLECQLPRRAFCRVFRHTVVVERKFKL